MRIKKILATLAVAIMLAANAQAAQKSKKKSAAKNAKATKEEVMLLHNMGLVAITKEEYDTAIMYLKKVVKLDPKYARPYTDLGKAYTRTSNTTEALKVLKISLELDPRVEGTHIALAETYYRKRITDKAVAECKTAIEINSSSLNAWGVLGIIYYGTNDDSNAIYALEKYAFMKEYNDSEMKEKYYMVLRSDRAETAYSQNCYFLAQIYYRHQNYDSAVLNLEKARPGYEDDPNFHFLLASSFLQSGKNDQAIEEYEAGLQISPDLSAYYNLGQIYYKRNDFEKATLNLEKARAGFEKEQMFYFFLGMSYHKTGKYDQAIEEYAKGLDLAPDEPSYLYNLACSCAKKGDAKKSIEWLRKAIQKYPAFKESAKTDEDFDPVRNSPDFKEITR